MAKESSEMDFIQSTQSDAQKGKTNHEETTQQLEPPRKEQ